MRQIKFRGHTGNEWVYGFLWGSIDPTKEDTTFRAWFIYTGVSIEEGHKVDPASVGQFSGLLDKNGKEILEGDILASAWDTMLRLWLIEFSDGSFTNVNIGVDGYLGERFKLTQEKCSERVVVGNRFERPDLLK